MNQSAASSIALPYDNAEQQRESAALGMWIFLATEVLFFGGLFVGYVVYRHAYPQVFHEGSQRLTMMTGALMTAVLLLGSLLVALSDLWIRTKENPRVAITWSLAITAVLGVAFLGLEFHEYGELIGDKLFPGKNFDAGESASTNGRTMELFFCLFFFMTGLHAFHMILGVSIVAGLAIAFYRSSDASQYRTLLENIGLYWHFVDIVWVFLFPLFYLVEG